MRPGNRPGRARAWLAAGAVAALPLLLGCAQQPPVVNVQPPEVTVQPPAVTVQAPPCQCECASAFEAKAPQVGSGCWVQDDVLICPLVHRNVEIEPAFPGEDPRCKRQPDGSLRCEVRQGP